MNRRDLFKNTGILLLLGIGWGITQPLTKIAVSTGHGYFGLVFWQLVIGVITMSILSLLRGMRLPLHRSALWVYLVIALIGTVIPDTASYQAIVYLPSGVISALMSLIPIIAFPIALGFGIEDFSKLRLGGLLIGLVGVSFLILPQASLPEQITLIWIPVALLAVVCYALESNVMAKWGTAGVDGIGVMFGASLIGAIIVLPLAVASDQFISPFRIWAAPEWALLAASVVHVVVYAGFVWLVGRTGSVFAVQVSYIVTGAGVLWAMLLLGERFAANFWIAMGLVLTGVFMVQPRPQDSLAPNASMGEK